MAESGQSDTPSVLPLLEVRTSLTSSPFEQLCRPTTRKIRAGDTNSLPLSTLAGLLSNKSAITINFAKDRGGCDNKCASCSWTSSQRKL